MTNKEAIEVLKNHISPYDNCKADNEANQAIRLAIKALEERPKGDAISRSALKEAIRKRLCISSLKYLTEQEKVIVEEIDNAPTVDYHFFYNHGFADAKRKFERPKGEWIKADNLYDTIVCNKCGGIRRDNRIDHIAFCNKCGAKMDMRGEKE